MCVCRERRRKKGVVVKKKKRNENINIYYIRGTVGWLLLSSSIKAI